MKLKELSTVRSGIPQRAWASEPGDRSARVILAKHISRDGSICSMDQISSFTDIKRGKKLAQGDVLFVNRGRFVSAAISPPPREPCLASGAILVLTPAESLLHPEYLAFFLNSTRGQALLHRHSETTTVPYIKAANLAELDIPVPDLARQQKLVALHRALNEHKNLTAQKHLLFQAILSGQNPS